MTGYPKDEVYFVRLIDEILHRQDAELDKLEKKVLADALILIEREEPYQEVLGQLYGRLLFMNDENDGADFQQSLSLMIS